MSGAPHPTPSAQEGLDRDFVLARCRYFATVRLWPTVGEGLDAARWLTNFTEGEELHAVYLLNAYLYFSERIIDRVFIEAIQSLGRHVLSASGAYDEIRRAWRRFMTEALFVAVRGERPNPSDSGALFARRARDLLHIDEAMLFDPAAAAKHLAASKEDTPVVLIDDFLGTGSQFLSTWQRKDARDPSAQSFQELAGMGKGQYFYCPVIATAYGVQNLHRVCPEVRVHAGHMLPDRYSAFASDSLIWPTALQPTAEAFLASASARAGIPSDPTLTTYWKGFHSLGLALSFVHGTPDATLPIFHWNQNGWKPLLTV